MPTLSKLRSLSIHQKIVIPFVFLITLLAGIIIVVGTDAIFDLVGTGLAHAIQHGPGAVTNELLQIKQQIFWGGIGLVVALILILMIVYSFIINLITREIRQLKSVALKVSQGDFTQRLNIRSGDELGQLANIFNEMTSNLQSSTASVVAEKNRSEAIIEEMPQGVVFTDMDGDVLMLNLSVRQHFSLPQVAVSGFPISRFIPFEDVLNFIDATAHGSAAHTLDWIYETPQKEKKYFKLRSRLVRNALQEKLGVVTVFEDVTLEKMLIELREGFLRTITHELRTPLTSIIGFIELARSGPGIDERQQKYLSVSLECAINLKTMINDLLDLSKIEAGKVELRLTPVNVFELAEDVIESMVPALRDKGLMAKNYISNGLPLIKADKEKLRRIFVNLLGNAVKFTSEGGIVINGRLDGKVATFSVKDSGIGLDEADKLVIFEKFRQVDYSSTRKYEGIGLGLSIVKELVELHGGDIRVESQPGQGSEFIFSLPYTATSP